LVVARADRRMRRASLARSTPRRAPAWTGTWPFVLEETGDEDRSDCSTSRLNSMGARNALSPASARSWCGWDMTWRYLPAVTPKRQPHSLVEIYRTVPRWDRGLGSLRPLQGQKQYQLVENGLSESFSVVSACRDQRRLLGTARGTAMTLTWRRSNPCAGVAVDNKAAPTKQSVSLGDLGFAPRVVSRPRRC
jgi:hypothetical protein